MSTRAKSRPRMTLLAFQDIIMSVSGILIVLVLMLAIELVQQPQISSSQSSSLTVSQPAESLSDFVAEKSRLDQAVERNSRLLADATLHSETELRREIASLTAESFEIGDEVVKLRARVESAERPQQEVERAHEEMRGIEQQLHDLTLAAENLQKELNAARADERPVFTLPKGEHKEGWLVVVGADEIGVAPLGRRSAPLSFTSTKGLLSADSAAQMFLKWTHEQSSDSSYYFLVVRPSSSSSFEEIQSDLAERQIPFGFDVTGSNTPLLHPSKGAFN